jgi:hypothetical protein
LIDFAVKKVFRTCLIVSVLSSLLLQAKSEKESKKEKEIWKGR